MRRMPLALAAAFLLSGCPALMGLLGGSVSVTGTVKAELTNGVAFLGSNDIYRISSFSSELPMAGGIVQVTDTTGAGVGVASATTDGNGNYSLSKVPTGKTLLLVATQGASGGSGNTVTVEALWNGQSTRALDTVSTMAAAGILHDSALSASQLASLGADKITALETALDAAVGDTASIPDLTSPSDVLSKFQAEASGSTSVASAYAALSK